MYNESIKSKGEIKMRKQAIEILRRHPDGMRIRELAYDLHISNYSCGCLLRKMRNEGTVKGMTVRDIGNMEYYDLWTLVKEGE